MTTVASPAVAGGTTLDGNDIFEPLDGTLAADAPAPGLNKPAEEGGYDPDRYRDTTRSYIAYWLLFLLTLVILGSFASLATLERDKLSFENLRGLLELIFGPLVALVSAATGFYFGAQSGQPRNGRR